jgi:hypothetical protein
MDQTFNSPAPAPATAQEAAFDMGTGKLSVFLGNTTPAEVAACKNSLATSSAPSGFSDADAVLWRNQESFKCNGDAVIKELSVADMVLTGSLQNYMDLGTKGMDAPAKTPGYPNTWSSTTMTQWPTEGAQAISSGTNLPSLQAWNLKDDQGQLYEVVYTGASGTSNVLYKNSTTRPEHAVSLTPGGSKVEPKPVAPASEPPEGETSLFFNLSSCCSSFVFCAGLVFLSSMLVPKR